jgi:peroxiredoxin
MRLTLFALLTLVTAAAAAAAAVGQPAPDFTLPGADGKIYTLSSFKGKYVVLEWTNHECPFVRKHYESGNMQAQQKEITAKGVVWLSIVSSRPGQ